MPAEEKGFLSKHFDKILSGVVGIMLILCAFYALRRNRSGDVKEVAAVITQLSKTIEEGMQQPPEPEPRTDYVQRLRTWQDVPEAALMRDFMNHNWMKVLEPAYVGTEKEDTISFPRDVLEQGINPDSLKIVQDDEKPLLTWAESPVEGNPFAIKVKTTKKQGEAAVRFDAGKRSFSVPVIVKKGAGEPALPPRDFAAVAQRDGIRISFKRNPKNKQVTRYEIHRKDALDPGSDFVLAQTFGVEGPGALESRGQPGAGSPGPGLGGGRGTGRGGTMGGFMLRMMEETEELLEVRETEERSLEEEEEKGARVWVDRKVTAGVDYTYKVRTFARYAKPRLSEFTDAVQVTARPTVGLMFTGKGSQRGHEFEVALERRAPADFYCARGDQIGGVKQDTPYLTGAYLLDYHQRILRERKGMADRIVYLDSRGNVKILWEEQKTTPDLWKRGREEEPSRERGVPGWQRGTGRERHVSPVRRP